MVSSSIEYTPTSKTICENGLCTKTLYSGIMFVEEDNQWKSPEEAFSLKDKGFTINYLEVDKDYDIEVIDFNATSIKVKLTTPNFEIFNKEIPVRIWASNETKLEDIKKIDLSTLEEKETLGEITKEEKDALILQSNALNKPLSESYKILYSNIQEDKIDFNLFNQKDEKLYDMKMGDILEFGHNSTTIILQDNVTENLGDTYVSSSNPNTNYGNVNYMRAGPDISNYMRSFISWNLSSIPSNSIVNSAYMNLTKISSSGSSDVGIWYVNQTNEYSINETNLTYNNNKFCYGNFSDIFNCSNRIDTQPISSSWYFDIKEGINFSINNNLKKITFMMDLLEYSGFNYYGFKTKEYTTNISLRPYLNITYEEIPCEESLVNTSWSEWENLTCSGEQMNQSRFLTQYDENMCVSNLTIYEYQLVNPIYINTSWSEWGNESCLITDLMNQSRTLTQYDEYSCASNSTFTEYQQTESCDFCTPSLVNTSWSEWGNTESCQIDETQEQSRSLVQYDTNNCGEIENITFTEYQSTSCTYLRECSSGEKIGHEFMKIAIIILLLGIVGTFGYFSYKEGELGLGKIILFFIMIVVGLVLTQVSFDNLAGGCT